MLERLGCALHAALQLVDVEITRGHIALPTENLIVEAVTLACVQPRVTRPVSR
jgi:hypothetical protein